MRKVARLECIFCGDGNIHAIGEQAVHCYSCGAHGPSRDYGGVQRWLELQQDARLLQRIGTQIKKYLTAKEYDKLRILADMLEEGDSTDDDDTHPVPTLFDTP